MEKKNAAKQAQSITIDGISYPLVMTMGAFLEFKRLTGREATEVSSESISDTLTLLHCILKSGQKREGYSYPYASADELACMLTPDDLKAIKII